MPDTHSKIKIAVIGGGPAAISLCKQLFNSFKESSFTGQVEIAVFEKNDKIGIGLPYSKDEKCYILNLPKDIMEPVQGETGNFAQWLKTQPDCPQGTDYPPRYFFGRYLTHQAKQLAEQTQNPNFKVRFYTQAEVNDVQQTPNGNYEVTCDTQNYQVNYVVLCTGHMPSANYAELLGKTGYQHNPWHAQAYTDVKKEDTIGIIGTRLTAIDVALKLKSQGHTGKIFMASRSGLLPAVLAKSIPSYGLRYLTLNAFDTLTKSGLENLKLADLMKLFWQEISTAEGRTYDFDMIAKSYQDISALDWLNQEIGQAETGVRPWQQVLFALYPITTQIWSMLSLTDKKTFLKEHHGLFMTYLAAFPLSNAYKIRDMVRSEQLKVFGGLDTVRHENGIFHLRVAENQTLTTQHLFNATGPSYNAESVPLLKRMMQRGLIQKHPLGGIAANHVTLEVLDKEQKNNNQVFAVGELTRGVCLATTDMTRVSLQSNRVATCLTRHAARWSTPVVTQQKYPNKFGLYSYTNVGHGLLSLQHINVAEQKQKNQTVLNTKQTVKHKSPHVRFFTHARPGFNKTGAPKKIFAAATAAASFVLSLNR